MQARIERLRTEIARVRQLSLTADTMAAADLRALADEMEQTVTEMQEKLDLLERLPGQIDPQTAYKS